VWCVPHYEERWRALSSLRFSMVHLRALRAGSKHRLVSWCSCHDSDAEVLFNNQARVCASVGLLAPSASKVVQCLAVTTPSLIFASGAPGPGP